MIKSLEVIIAITILFSFLLLVFQNIPQQNIQNNQMDRIFNILKLKADNSEFRSKVNDSNLTGIYSDLYDYIDVSYGVSICFEITNDCNTYNIDNNYKITNTIDYYFFDSNKTILIKTWAE